MLFPRINREDAEKIYTVIHNVDGTTITTGMGARYVGGDPAEAVSADGISAVKLTVAADPLMRQFSGIAKKDIPADDYGIVQCWGAVDSVYMSNVADKTAGTQGGIAQTFLRPGGVAGTFMSAAPATVLSSDNGLTGTVQYFQNNTLQIWNTIGISGGVNHAKGFVRAL